MESTMTDLRSTLVRATGYRLLAHLLTPPEEGWVQVSRALAEEADLPPDALTTTTDEDVLLEHQHVFAPTGPLSSCASDHVAEGFAGKGSILGDVAGFYAAFGYEPELREPPDHFALQFGFLALLAMKQAAMAHAGNEEEADVAYRAEMDLLATHVLPHLEPFRTRLEAVTSPDGVYRRVGALMGVHLVEETDAAE